MRVSYIKDKDVTFIEVKNDKNLEVTLCSFGASFYKIIFKGKNRIMTPLNYDEFYHNEQYYGKLIGRFAGRINEAKCKINQVEYDLPKNWNGINSLHGGPKGISYSNFDYEVKETKDSIDVMFKYKELESYLPGDVSYVITYHVYKEIDEIKLDILANTTKETICNVTNHAYFTLSSGKKNVLDEELELACKYHGDLDNNLIAKDIIEVSEIMDFRKPHTIGKYIDNPYLQNHTSFGYDHFFVKENKNEAFIARLKDKEEGVELSIYTSYPAVVVYTDNYPTKMKFEGVDVEAKYQAIALECQDIPNLINMPGHENDTLKPNEEFRQYIRYHFQ